MPMPLEDWQRRLERHFQQLATARSNSGFPLFALEHDLTGTELEEIATELRARLALGLRLEPHWLLWVVYATELGYDYDGGEYWHSFEERTPRWSDKASRNQLREWFSRFQLTYQGVKPSGTWAGHFPIIAWPITHAILSKYLQWQFAKALYDLRYRLAGLEGMSPEAVGQLLAANAWEASSRFQEFLQQESLTGRIVLALLTDTSADGQSPIYPPTLQRLVSDLERVQSTGEWLKETRRFVADRLKGAGRGATGGRLTEAEAQAAGQDESDRTSLRLRPTLMLRRSGASAWSAVVDVPSFAGIARLSPDYRTFLTNTRCKIAGTGETWLPKGWLLSNARRRVLKSWPAAGVPLVQFEMSNSMLDHLIGSETRLSAGPVWICRIGRDGLAHEIAGRIVRPGLEYILISEKEALLSRHRFLSACDLNCHGVSAAVLSMPDTISHDILSGLQQLGLHVARTIRIWPAGLSSRAWDGEGYSEWLTTEAPCFGIVHDHPVEQYGLSLNNGPETLLKAREVGSPLFVKLSPLPVGRHTLWIRARRGYQSSQPSSSNVEGVVTLEVREPEPWLPGTTAHAGLAISLEPHDPSLDTFWEGDVAIGVLGPAGHHVTCAISLSNASGAELLSDVIGTFDLPVTTAEWQKKLLQFVRDEDRSWTYLEAASGRFSIKGDELGEYALRLERDVKPLRWACRSVNRVATVRLIDDTGRDEAAVCRFFSLRRPAESICLDNDTVLEGFPVPVPGGLFEARHGDCLDTIIVSVPQSGGGLQGLGVEPDLHDLDGDAVSVTYILNLLQQWTDARLLGPLVGLRRSRVAERLLNRLYSHLCGKRWAEAEAAYVSNPRGDYELRQLERLVGGSQGFPVVLRRDYERMEAGTGQGVQWYSDVAKRYQVCSEAGLSEFALQLASNPCHLLRLPKPALDGLLLEIKANTVLLRGARLLALLAASKEQGFASIGLPRWKW